jgi:predicted O-methyltransferase YrrM
MTRPCGFLPPSASRIRSVLDRLLREGTVVARSNGEVHDLFPVAIPEEEGAALRQRVIRERACRTIEVGLGYGIASLFACEGLVTVRGEGAHHVAIDPNQATRFANCGLQVLDAAGLADVIEFHDEGSETALPRFLAEGRTFDLAFVDGNHRFDGVFLDLVYLGRLVRPGGIVVADDCQLPSVRRAVSFCATNLDWTIEETSTANAAHHWVVLRTPSAARHRNFDDYVTF